MSDLSFNDAESETDAQRRQGLDPSTAYAELGQIMLGDKPLGMVLERVADLASRAIPGAAEVSVTLMDHETDTAKSVAFSGDLAVDLDERQYERGYGPCLDAARTGSVIEIKNTANDDTYPDFAKQCARRGVTHTLSVGLPVPTHSVGAINIYGTTGEKFDADARDIARSFASYAAVALANAALYTSTAELAQQMQKAMNGRAVIEQAKGIVMAKHGGSAEEAFARLVQQSQHENRKLRDICQELVTAAETTGPENPQVRK